MLADVMAHSSLIGAGTLSLSVDSLQFVPVAVYEVNSCEVSGVSCVRCD